MKNRFDIVGDTLIVYNRSDNKPILFDAADFDYVSQFTWCLMNTGYACTKLPAALGKKQVLAHRLLMNPPKGMTVDHINNDRADNRRSNLRVVSNQVNCHNRKNTTGYYWRDDIGKFQVKISFTQNGKHRQISGGCYKTANEARQRHLELKMQYHIDVPEEQYV